MSAKIIETHILVLVVVQSGDQFALIQEKKYGSPWFLPAGRVKAGESLLQAARRETREEAGIDVEITGLLGMEYLPALDAPACFRFIFAARPKGNAELKDQPDRHSLCARWVRLEELNDYTLRYDEVEHWFKRVAEGREIYPLQLLEEVDIP
jgi:phosphatase NudJ